MQAIILIALYTFIVVIDVPLIAPNAKANRNLLVVYGLIIVCGFTISLLLIMKQVPTSPSKVIESIVKGIIGEM